MTLIPNATAAVNKPQSIKTENGKTAGETFVGFGETLMQQLDGSIAAGSQAEGVPLSPRGIIQQAADLIALLNTAEQPVASGETVEPSGNAALNPAEGILENLLNFLIDSDVLEDKLENNPELLQEIQHWLLQAAAVLNTGKELQTPGNQLEFTNASDGPLLSPLASDTATVRFALQDTLMQLSDMAKSIKSGAGKEQLMDLLKSFQAVLGEQPTAQVNREVSKAAVVQVQPAGQELLIQEQVKGSAVEAEGTASLNDFPEQQTVTAGQLALRSGAASPLNAAERPVPVEQFAKEMTQFIVNKFEIVKQSGFTEARISLNPENLGQVDIKISLQNGQLVAQFLTRSADARELLDQQMAQLRTALQGQGLQVEKLEVTQSSQSSASQLFQDGRQSGSGQQQSDRRPKGKDQPNDDAVTAASLTEELNEWLAERAGEDITSGSFTARA